jgi:hypothetical protein
MLYYKMNMEKIVMCVVALLIGMLVANMLTNVCGCKTRVEGFNWQNNDVNEKFPEGPNYYFTGDPTDTMGCGGGNTWTSQTCDNLFSAYSDPSTCTNTIGKGSNATDCVLKDSAKASACNKCAEPAASAGQTGGFTATCGEIRDGGPAFDTCGTNKVYDDKKSSGQTLDDTNCCVDATCEKYSYSDGVYSPWPCTTGTYNSVANNATSPTDSQCCTTGAGAGAGTDCTTPSILDGPEYGTITETELNKNGFGVTLACADGYSTASPRPDSHGWADPGPPVGVPCAEDGGDYTVTNPCECVDRHDVERAALGQEPQCPTWALNGVCTHPTSTDKKGHDTAGQGWMNRNCAQSCSQCGPSVLDFDLPAGQACSDAESTFVCSGIDGVLNEAGVCGGTSCTIKDFADNQSNCCRAPRACPLTNLTLSEINAASLGSCGPQCLGRPDCDVNLLSAECESAGCTFFPQLNLQSGKTCTPKKEDGSECKPLLCNDGTLNIENACNDQTGGGAVDCTQFGSGFVACDDGSCAPLGTACRSMAGGATVDCTQYGAGWVACDNGVCAIAGTCSAGGGQCGTGQGAKKQMDCPCEDTWKPCCSDADSTAAANEAYQIDPNTALCHPCEDGVAGKTCKAW